MPPPRRRGTDGPPSPGEGRLSRRGALRLGAVALAGSVAGCSTGLLGKGSDATGTTTDGAPGNGTSGGEPTTHPTGVDTSLPEGSVEFPEGPKSRPERPAELTAASVREYVAAFERRWAYNELHRGRSTSVRLECAVESVSERGEGFRVVVRCAARATDSGGETTVHADYFARYATYFVGPDSVVRREGKSKTRR